MPDVTTTAAPNSHLAPYADVKLHGFAGPVYPPDDSVNVSDASTLTPPMPSPTLQPP